MHVRALSDALASKTIELRQVPFVLSSSLALVAVAALGVLQLPTPLHGDQALYQMGARRLADGARMYVDFWDGKSPGMYLFHLVAGKTFGWSAEALHALELIWQLSLAVCMTVLLRPLLKRQWLAPFAALFVVGGYYALADDWHLTQPAALMMLPIFLAGVCALRTRPGEAGARYWALASGLLVSLAAVFKEECVPGLLCFSALAATPKVTELFPNRYRWLEVIALFMLGFGIGAALFLAWIAWQGAWRVWSWTVWTYPIQARLHHNFWPLGRLAWIGHWFVTNFWTSCIVGLAMLFLRHKLKRRHVVLTVAALLIGVLTILLEPFAWWPFDGWILIPAVGVMVATSFDYFFSRMTLPTRWSRLAEFAVVMVTLIPVFYSLQAKVRQAMPWLLGRESAAEYRQRSFADHRCATASSAFLHDRSAAGGPVYVIGDPNLARLGGREQIGRVHGWGWEILLPHQIDEAVESIQVQRPAYIHVGHEFSTYLRDNLPGFRGWVTDNYRHQRSDAFGVWFGTNAIPAVTVEGCSSNGAATQSDG